MVYVIKMAIYKTVLDCSTNFNAQIVKDRDFVIYLSLLSIKKTKWRNFTQLEKLF